MTESEKTHNEFLEVIYNDFGAILINRKLSKWYTLNWNEFYQEMLNQKIDCKKCLNKNWENYFMTQKTRMVSFTKINAMVANSDKMLTASAA